MKDIGKRIRELRTKQGLTLRELGSMADLSHGFIADIEKGRKKPSIDAGKALAEALGVSAAWLMGIEEDPQGVQLVQLDNSERAKELLPELLTALEKAYPMKQANLPPLKELLNGLTDEQVVGVLRQVIEGVEVSDGKATVIMRPVAKQDATAIRIPLIEHPGQATSRVIGSITTDLPWGDYFAFRITDDGMNLAAMPAGALAIVEREAVVPNGTAAAVVVGGGPAMVRMYRDLGDVIMLEPRSTDLTISVQTVPSTQVRSLGSVVRVLVDM